MRKEKFSKTCGIGRDRCENWDSKSPSKCSIYTDINECIKSLKQARHSSRTSRQNAPFPGIFIR